MKTVRSFLRQHGYTIDPSVAPLDRTEEVRLLGEYGHLGADQPQQSYRRYGYGLANLVAQKFLWDHFHAFGLGEAFSRYRAKLFNAGMGAIVTVSEALRLTARDAVWYHPECYFGTATYMELLRRRGIPVSAVDLNNCGSVIGAIRSVPAERKVIFAEAMTNHPRMVVPRLHSLLDALQGEPLYILIDGSVLGAPSWDPGELITPATDAQILYVESLTKHYHGKSSSSCSAGLAWFPATLCSDIDQATAVFGTYLQLNDLLSLPFELFATGRKRIGQIVQNCKQFYQILEELDAEHRFAVTYSIPYDTSTGIGGDRWAGILFLEFHDTPTFTARERVEQFLQSTGVHVRGSFGHTETSVLPIGLRWPTVPDGLIRIAFGTEAAPSPFIQKAQQYFAVRESGPPP